jgi:murein DD-endopeptidase MepM/ murein hydrolase activator NlpD
VKRATALALWGLNLGVLGGALVAAGGVPAEDPAPLARPAPVATPALPLPAAVPTVVPSQPRPAVPPRPVVVRRSTTQTGWRPYASAGPVTLHFPVDVVEVVGLHQSGHDGAQPQQPVPDAGRIGLLDNRSRDTNPQGAADIAVDPSRPVRAPVTGTVVRAGTYTLYCDHVDHYLVVEPDARPGWEVKLLHFEGLRVGKGDRVRAGATVVGSHARVLPFASQVDKHTVAPRWPHLHVEVVDHGVPDRPSGSTCD